MLKCSVLVVPAHVYTCSVLVGFDMEERLVAWGGGLAKKMMSPSKYRPSQDLGICKASGHSVVP